MGRHLNVLFVHLQAVADHGAADGHTSEVEASPCDAVACITVWDQLAHSPGSPLGSWLAADWNVAHIRVSVIVQQMAVPP